MNFTTDSRFNFSRKQVDAINSEHYTSVLDLFERACSEFAEKSENIRGKIRKIRKKPERNQKNQKQNQKKSESERNR